MRFAFPKPLNGWRVLLGEVGIIVVGVLIALAAQQMVEDWNDRQRLAEAHRAISLELGDAAGQARVKIRAYRCTEPLFGRLAEIVDEAERTGRLPPVGELPQPNRYTWPSGAWQGLRNGSLADLESRDRLQGLSGIYAFVEALDRQQNRELEVWADIYQLVGPGRPFSAEEVARVRGSLREARLLNRLVTLQSIRILQLLKAYQIEIDRPSMELYLNSAVARAIATTCPGFGRVPARYGEAPLREVVIRANERPVIKPRR